MSSSTDEECSKHKALRWYKRESDEKRSIEELEGDWDKCYKCTDIYDEEKLLKIPERRPKDSGSSGSSGSKTNADARGGSAATGSSSSRVRETSDGDMFGGNSGDEEGEGEGNRDGAGSDAEMDEGGVREGYSTPERGVIELDQSDSNSDSSTASTVINQSSVTALPHIQKRKRPIQDSSDDDSEVDGDVEAHGSTQVDEEEEEEEEDAEDEEEEEEEE